MTDGRRKKMIESIAYGISTVLIFFIMILFIKMKEDDHISLDYILFSIILMMAFSVIKFVESIKDYFYINLNFFYVANDIIILPLIGVFILLALISAKKTKIYKPDF